MRRTNRKGREKVLLQTHAGNDTDHRLRSDRFAKILQLGSRVIPSPDLDVDVEYDCCVVAQYPIAEATPDGEHLNLILRRVRTQCRARERSEGETASLLRRIRGLLLTDMDLIQIYQCLCDRTRLRILHLLTRSPLCVCHFQDILGEPQVKISKHLSYLRNRGMVVATRDQNWMIYTLPKKRSRELETNLKCLQDCVQSDTTFARDLRKLTRLRERLLRARSSFRDQTKANDKIMKNKILFICAQNSARSQIAAALLNTTCGDYFEAHSAGLEPGVLNPLAVEGLQELGIDISRNKTQSVFDVWKSGQIFQFVVTVCSEV